MFNENKIVTTDDKLAITYFSICYFGKAAAATQQTWIFFASLAQSKKIHGMQRRALRQVTFHKCPVGNGYDIRQFIVIPLQQKKNLKQWFR